MNEILYAQSNFWDSPIGGVTVALLGAVGIIIAIVGVLNSVGKFLKGDIGKGMKTIIGALFLAAFCLAPEAIIDTLTSTFSNLLERGADSVDDIAGTGTGGR